MCVKKTLYLLQLEIDKAEQDLLLEKSLGRNKKGYKADTYLLQWAVIDANSAYQDALAEEQAQAKTLRRRISAYLSIVWVKVLQFIGRA